MHSIIKWYNQLKYKRKKIITFITISILILLSIIIWICTRRYIAKKAILDYIDNQGISRNDIVVEEFSKDWKIGGYNYMISIRDEDPEIYYKYDYYKGNIGFLASRMNAQWIKEKTWGGNFLSEDEEKNLKYPPLKD